MPEEALHHDDQSHYEISLTAGQAFLAFVLMKQLLKLAEQFRKVGPEPVSPSLHARVGNSEKAHEWASGIGLTSPNPA